MPAKSRKLLSPALLLSLLAVAFTFDAHGVHWLWSAQPFVAIALAAGALVCWALVAVSLHHQRAH